MSAKKPAPAKARKPRKPKPYRHYVYVIELARAVLYERKFQKANPDYNPERPCVYVGMTGLTPEQRFQNHKQGLKAAGVVRRFGERLVPRLYEHLNPMPYAKAKDMESILAESLRKRGFTVYGGH